MRTLMLTAWSVTTLVIKTAEVARSVGRDFPFCLLCVGAQAVSARAENRQAAIATIHYHVGNCDDRLRQDVAAGTRIRHNVPPYTAPEIGEDRHV